MFFNILTVCIYTSFYLHSKLTINIISRLPNNSININFYTNQTNKSFNNCCHINIYFKLNNLPIY